MIDWRDKKMALAQITFLSLVGTFLLILAGWLIYEMAT